MPFATVLPAASYAVQWSTFRFPNAQNLWPSTRTSRTVSVLPGSLTTIRATFGVAVPRTRSLLFRGGAGDFRESGRGYLPIGPVIGRRAAGSLSFLPREAESWPC